MTGSEPAGRRAAREAALQMLYQCEIARAGAYEAISSYWASREDGLDEPYRDFADRLVRGTLGRLDEIDALLSTHARNWRIERMAVLDRLVLRLGAYEMLAEPETPAKVVINEAIELARRFSGDEAAGFVNGVLDAVRKQLGGA